MLKNVYLAKYLGVGPGARSIVVNKDNRQHLSTLITGKAEIEITRYKKKKKLRN